jgi:hypothetical protein
MALPTPELGQLSLSENRSQFLYDLSIKISITRPQEHEALLESPAEGDLHG